ncbi:MAG: hypothetical protein KatS3mg087_0652 [Patescibacteria group bacterium]|nr:MAG: hypothetical protein KatS3mg087_0652 [Patescibacteria group bacterium]
MRVSTPPIPKIPTQNQNQGLPPQNVGGAMPPLPQNSGPIDNRSDAKANTPSLPPLDAILSAQPNANTQTLPASPNSPKQKCSKAPGGYPTTKK